MSDAIIQRSLEAHTDLSAARPLPKGYGLLVGLGVSIVMWVGLIWLAVRLFA